MIIADPLSSSLEELVVVVLILLFVVVVNVVLFVVVVAVVFELLLSLESSSTESTVIVDSSSIIVSFVWLVFPTKLGFTLVSNFVVVFPGFFVVVVVEFVSDRKCLNPPTVAGVECEKLM